MEPIDDKYQELGGSMSFLGAQRRVARCADGVGHAVLYEHGAIYSHPQTGVHEVHGAILERWNSLGGVSGSLGYPTTDESTTPDGFGRYNHFEHGSIYWTPKTGAWDVRHQIRERWANLGWERSLLGYPITGELSTPDGLGRYNHFQYGSIYSHPQGGTFEVHNAIRDKWAELGWERSVLGYPTTGECTTPDHVGRYNHFQHGSIYWHPRCGAHEIHGAILEEWAKGGWEQGDLGYPTCDESHANDFAGRYSNFQGGSIYWSAFEGTRVMKGGTSPWSVTQIISLNFTSRWHRKETTHTGFPGVLFTKGTAIPEETPGEMRVGYWNDWTEYSGIGNWQSVRSCWRGFVFFDTLPKFKVVQVLKAQLALEASSTVWWHGDTASNERISGARYLYVLEKPFSGFDSQSRSWGTLPAFSETVGQATYSKESGFLTIDVTDLVQGWMGGTVPAYGLLFTGADESYAERTVESLMTDYKEPTLTVKFIAAN